MPATVECLPDAPIVILKFSDVVSRKDVTDAYLKGLESALRSHRTFYWVVDILDAPTSYLMVVATLQEILQGLVGAPIMPSMQIGCAGLPVMCAAFNTKIPSADVFFSRQEAMHFAQARFAEHALP